MSSIERSGLGPVAGRSRLSPKQKRLFGLIVALPWLLAPTTATATSLTFDDLTDVIHVEWTGFDQGFFLNGIPQAHPDGSTDFGGGASESTGDFQGTWGFNGGLTTFSGGGKVYFLDPGTSVYSDNIVVAFSYHPNDPSGLGQQCAGFDGCASVGNAFLTSDTEGVPFTPTAPPGSVIMDETGGWQDLSGVTGASSVGLTVSARSDASEVPEPCSLLLLGSGVLGLGRTIRRRMAQ